MKLYQIDYKRLVLLLLPTFLRQPRLFAFLQAMTFSVSELHGRFMKQRDVNLLRMKRNGQVCYLRGLLNDELDGTERRITVTDGEANGGWVFAMDEREAYQLFVDARGVMVCREDLIRGNAAAFVVTVPRLDADSMSRLRSLLNDYKLLSKKYTIRYE